jgi:hypothetical protein
LDAGLLQIGAVGRKIFQSITTKGETEMSKFIPRKSEQDGGILKFAAGAGAPIPMSLEKVGAGERELGLSGQVQHRTGDGVIRDLSRLLNSFYVSLPKDPRLLSAAEKDDLYRQIIAALGAEGALTDYAKDLARRLAALDYTDGQVESKQWQAQGAANSQAREKENGGYPTPRQPADRPSSVAKGADMVALRQQILALRDRINALVARQEARR